MVSIILVTYNRASRLKLSIQDILSQDFKEFELIICDDCSTDSTRQVCESLQQQDDRIQYYRHTINLGMPGNLNFGIKKAKNEYIAILHDGDRFNTDLIRQWYTGITSSPSIGFVFNSIGLTDKDEQIVHFYREFAQGPVKKEYLLHKVFFRRWMFDSPVYGEAMVKKSLVENYGYLNPVYGFYADVDLWLHLLHTHDAYYCEETLITGPEKILQPQLFDNKIIVTFFYMFNMHLIHRKTAFNHNKFILIKELIIFYIQAFFCFNYNLLLVSKNSPTNIYLESRRLILKNGVGFFILWLFHLLFLPVIKLIGRYKALNDPSL